MNTCNYECRSSLSGWTCAGNIAACFNGGMPDVNTCTCDCHNSFTGWTCTGNIWAYFINGNVWCQPRNCQWLAVKNETLREKRWFQFSVCRNIPVASAYEVYLSQLIQYSRACGSYQDFLDRWLLLTRKLLNQGFLLFKLKSSLRKWLIFEFVIRLTRQVPLVEQEMFTLSEHLSSSLV